MLLIFNSEIEVVLKHGKSPINCTKPYFKNKVLVGRSKFFKN